MKSSNTLRVLENSKSLAIYDDGINTASIAFPPVTQTMLQSVFESDAALEERHIASYGKYADAVEAQADAATRIYEARIKADLARHRFQNRPRLFEQDDAKVTAALDNFAIDQQDKFARHKVELARYENEYESLSLDTARLRAAKNALLSPAPSAPAITAPKAATPPRLTEAERHAQMVSKRNALAQLEKNELAEIIQRGGSEDEIRIAKNYFQSEREKLVG